MSWRFPRRRLSALGRRGLPQLFNALSLSAPFPKHYSGGWVPQSCEDGKPRPFRARRDTECDQALAALNDIIAVRHESVSLLAKVGSFERALAGLDA